MKININQIRPNKDNIFEEEIVFKNGIFNPNTIRKVNKCLARANFHLYDDFLNLSLQIEYEVILPCAYTLKDVVYKNKDDDNIIFKDEVDQDSECLPRSGVIDVDYYVYSLLLASIPTRVVSKDASTLEEDKEKKKGNSFFDILDKLDID